MIGDSIVFWAGQSEPRCTSTGCLKWLGVRGARLSALTSILHRHISRHPVPRTVIVHLGTNDLFSIPLKDIRNSIEGGLNGIRHLLPNTSIIWSDILLRLFYYGEQKQGVGKKCVLSLNKFADKLCSNLGNAHAIVHSHNINPPQHSLYYRDGLHLSSTGNVLLQENLHNALAFFALYPEALLYPSNSSK